MRSVLAGWTGVTLFAPCVCAQSAGAEEKNRAIELIATIKIPFDAVDASGLEETIPGGVPHNRLGGIGSAIEYAGGDEYIMLPDRGPIDGGSPYATRIQRLRLEFLRGEPRWRLLSTTLLKAPDGTVLIGAADRINAADPFGSARFDPEGLRVEPDGTIFISEEYGPRIDVFGADGARRGSLEIPATYRPEHFSSIPEEELPPHSTRGRQPNRGLEGLARTPSGLLMAIPQSPLLQDGALDADGTRAGVNIRVLTIDPREKGADQAGRQWIYPLDEPSYGVSEMLAVDEHRLLVLERDGKAGGKARFKRIMLANISKASDVTTIASLPSRGLPSGIEPASKRVLIDLLDPRFKLAGDAFPEKIEGLCFGPRDEAGRATLLVATDNDFKDQDSIIWVFAIPAAMLDLPPGSIGAPRSPSP